MESMISPSVIVSQRHIMRPYSGCSRISFSRSSEGRSNGLTTSWQIPFQSDLSASESFSATRPVIYSPIAGQAVRPGDSIPAQSKKPGQSATSSMIKSPPSSCDLKPENDVITCFNGKFLTLRAEPSITLAMPSAVAGASSLLSLSIAVGPMIVLPCTVGVTRIPLPRFVGCGKIICLTKPSQERSSKR